MEYVELTIQERKAVGSNNMRRLRATGSVPAVVYGAGREALVAQLDTHEFTMAARGKNHGQIFKFKSETAGLNGTLALVKEIHIEPKKERLLHVDFLAVNEDQQVHVKVPLVIFGEPSMVKEGRGTVNQQTYELEIKCVMRNIPSELRLDVSGLDVGDSLHASDVPLPEGAELYVNDDLVIVSALSTAAEEPKAGAEAAAK